MNAFILREFPEASFTGPPNRCQIGQEQGAVFLSRPKGGGPICVLYVVSGDARNLIPPVDLRPFLGDADCFAADVFVSGIDGTIKAFVNIKPVGKGGNDRALVVVETGIVPF